MKTLPILFIASLGIALAEEDESANYLNFIMQVQNDENRTTHKIDDVSPVGNGNALKGVTGSSVFRLWTIHRTKGTEYLLDEKIVSSYHPEARISITTGDDYKGIPRTRVDQPFTVSYTVEGLVTNDPKVQNAAKSVVLQTTARNYIDSSNADATGAERTTQGVIDKNGTTRESRLTTLQAPDLTRVSGEEEFTIYARPDYGVAESHMLARAKVQVWPIARATMKGFDTGKQYLKLPDVHIDLQDLYPDSTTYVRVYEGKPRSNPKQVHIVNTSYVIIDDTVPKDRKFSLSGKELGITQSGKYTLEIIHETPFGADILSQTYPLNKKGNIKVIGNLNTSE